MRRARTRTLSLSSVRGSAKRACSRTTVTPRPSKRSWLSIGAMVSMTWRMCALTAGQSTRGGALVTPSFDAVRTTCARSPAAISAFDGTQP